MYTVKEAKVLQKKKPNNISKKYKQLTHMTLVANPVSQPSPNVSPIWIPIINKKVGKLQCNLV
jgi:hypothetical protein